MYPQGNSRFYKAKKTMSHCINMKPDPFTVQCVGKTIILL